MCIPAVASLHQTDDHKSGAVVAQRGDIVTRRNQDSRISPCWPAR